MAYFTSALRTIKEMVKEIIKQRQENPPQPHERAFIDVLMDHTDMYPESTLLDDAMSYMIGGFHTSGNRESLVSCLKIAIYYIKGFNLYKLQNACISLVIEGHFAITLVHFRHPGTKGKECCSGQ